MRFGKNKRPFKRLFVAADLHGSELVFRKLLSTADFYEADALLIAGDVTAKTIAPIVQQKDGRFRTRFSGKTHSDLNEEQLKPLEQAIGDSGQYPARLSEDEYEATRTEPDRVDALFTRLMIEQIQRWVNTAEAHLSSRNVPLYWIGGNDDKVEALSQVLSTNHVHYIDESVMRFDDDHEILGFGWTNPSPWATPRELPEDQLAPRLSKVMKQVRDPDHAIYLMHVPPYETGLDIAPKLDSSTYPPRPVIQGGQQVLIPVGSTAVRSALEDAQPLLALHGHIHETRNSAKIHRTVCVDPGSEYSAGTLRGVIINLERDRVLSYQFTSG
jgi:Icc-related predicted phosphoesterase